MFNTARYCLTYSAARNLCDPLAEYDGLREMAARLLEEAGW